MQVQVQVQVQAQVQEVQVQVQGRMDGPLESQRPVDQSRPRCKWSTPSSACLWTTR